MNTSRPYNKRAVIVDDMYDLKEPLVSEFRAADKYTLYEQRFNNWIYTLPNGVTIKVESMSEVMLLRQYEKMMLGRTRSVFRDQWAQRFKHILTTIHNEH